MHPTVLKPPCGPSRKGLSKRTRPGLTRKPDNGWLELSGFLGVVARFAVRLAAEHRSYDTDPEIYH